MKRIGIFKKNLRNSSILNNETNHILIKELKNKNLVELKNDKILLKEELKKSRDKAIELAEEGLNF